jgi:hypothetical protein
MAKRGLELVRIRRQLPAQLRNRVIRLINPSMNFQGHERLRATRDNKRAVETGSFSE